MSKADVQRDADKLRAMWATGMTQEAIAFELGIDAASLRRRAKVLGLPARRERRAPWTDAEHNQLVEGYRPDMSDAAAEALVPTRTALAIRTYYRRLGSVPRRPALAGATLPPA